MNDDRFQLFDLRVRIESVAASCTCDVKVGDSFTASGCKLRVEASSGFCLFALQSTLPLIPAKQRSNHPADWMESDSLVACPGTTCGVVMRIERIGTTEFRHDDVSEVKWREFRK